MSTRSRIGYLENGVVRSIYCHFDGYLEFNGKMLNEHYQDLEKIKKLIELGSISSLGENLEASEVIKKYGFSYIFNEEFSKLPEDEQERLKEDGYYHVVAYHRDRAEDLEITEEPLSSFKRNAKDSLEGYFNEEFFYLFVNGKWRVAHYENNGFRPLTDELKKIEQ